MIIITMLFVFIIMGYFLLMLTYMIPIFRLIYLDWIAMIVMTIPTILTIIRLGTSKSIQIFEKKPVGKELTIFLRRDGTVDPMYMTRPFKSMSFLESKDMGLIHDLGKGSVYRWGDKNVRFILENVPHTPDPRFVNFTDWLYNLGFNNIDDVKNALQGNNGSEIIEEIVEYTPVDKLVTELKNVEENGNFVPKIKRMNKIIDGWKKK